MVSTVLSKNVFRTAILAVICFIFSSPRPAWCDPLAHEPDRADVGSQNDDESKKRRRNVDGPFPKGPNEEGLAARLGDRYKSLYTDHFVVLCDADAKVVRSFLPRLERTYKSVLRFSNHLGIDVQYEGDKLPVIFCSSRKEYEVAYQQITGAKQAPPKQSVGRYNSSANACIFYDISDFKEVHEYVEKARRLQEQAKKDPNRNSRASKLRTARKYLNRAKLHVEDQNRTAVQHEVAHQLLYNFGVHNSEGRHHNPKWLVEGMAMLFEPPPGKSGAGFGVVNQRRLGVIRENIGSLTAADWRNLVAPSVKSQGMLSREGYGQAWALTYYLMKRKRTAFKDYLGVIRERSPTIRMPPTESLAEFEEFFGTVDDQFARQIAHFVSSLPTG